jgi:hypothetical protein
MPAAGNFPADVTDNPKKTGIRPDRLLSIRTIKNLWSETWLKKSIERACNELILRRLLSKFPVLLSGKS